MNGAMPVPPSTTSTPRSSSTRMIGVIHHFLLWRRKLKSSPAMPLDFCSARRAKSLLSGVWLMVHIQRESELTEIALRVGHRLVLDPVRRRGTTIILQAQRVLADRSHKQADRQEY